MKTVNLALVFGAISILSLAVSLKAAEPLASQSLSALKSVKLAELPAKAAALVAAADTNTLIQTTMDVVKAAVGLNPAGAASIVGAIAAGTPDAAEVAAATAAGILPKQAGLIARVAAAAAPQKAAKIVEAVCRVAPVAYQDIALAVSEVAPDQSRAILAAIAAALPKLNYGITNALAGYPGANPSVVAILAQASRPGTTLLAAGSPASIQAHAITPTYTGSGFTPPAVIILPENNAPRQTNGRNYANPPIFVGNNAD